MPIGLDPQATCVVDYEGVKLKCRYMTIGQRIRLNAAREDAMKAMDDEAALNAITAALTVGGVLAIDGKPLDTLADTFTLREAIVLLYQLPGLVSELEDSLKKASPSSSQSAPGPSAPPASVPAGQ